MVHRWFYEHENPLIVLLGPLYLNWSMKHRVATVPFWLHLIMKVKLAQAGEGGGAGPPPFTTITSTVAVFAPADWADTLTLFHL
jgi:hypothetical protein